MKIAISGGHSTGLGLIEEIQKKHPLWQIYYFGCKFALEGEKAFSFDYKIVSQIKGVRFISLTTGRLARKIGFLTFFSLLKIPCGFARSLYYLFKLRPDLIVSFGGYVSVPLVIAGWILGIPSITHEQTQVLGLATKINQFFVKKVALAYSRLMDQLPKGKGVYTGMPLRAILNNKTNPGDLKELKEALEKSLKPLLFITTGKAGSRLINQVIVKIVPELSKKFLILHQMGEFGYSNLNKNLKWENYYPVSLLGGLEQSWVLNKADLVISRSGANITFELLFLRKPAILIPLQFSPQDEQKKNADWFVSLGGGERLLQKDLNEKTLGELIEKVYQNKKKYLLNLEKVKIENGSKKLLALVEEILE
ncbi:glycosyltransferase [Candidatus Shapirobacteria bacterium]|nr:glycosyltransferase [Candidatus Shapirobacteria bacterium]